MEKFKRKTIIELLKSSREELIDYYRNLRKFNYENEVPLKGIETRKIIHNLPLLVVKLDRLLKKEEITILKDERLDTDKPKIYACTHIGGNDIERAFEAIKEHCYLFLGDPGVTYKTPTGLLLYLNGTISLETRDKTDRRIAKSMAIELLKSKGDLLIFPEGAWNITENLPVMKLFTGTVEMAIESGAEIIPIAIEQVEKNFYVSIGENINYTNYNINQKKELTDELRDVLCTLIWEIWEHLGYFKRKEISQEFKENYVQSIIDKCDLGYTAQDVLETKFKDKNVVEYDEVFSFEKKLKLSRNNAFLLKKRK